jgi:hypothetical protein
MCDATAVTMKIYCLVQKKSTGTILAEFDSTTFGCYRQRVYVIMMRLQVPCFAKNNLFKKILMNWPSTLPCTALILIAERFSCIIEFIMAGVYRLQNLIRSLHFTSQSSTFKYCPVCAWFIHLQPGNCSTTACLYPHSLPSYISFLLALHLLIDHQGPGNEF